MPHYRNFMNRVHHEIKADFRRQWSESPPLKRVTTTRKYHDDETFMAVSLELLARYQALNLSANESIILTLVCPDDQLAYYEALCFRLSKIHSVRGYSPCSMIQILDRAFSTELRNLCSYRPPDVSFPEALIQVPMTPRHDRNHAGLNFQYKHNKKQTRRFFPDVEPRSHRPQSKVRNVDQQLATAIQQVVSLSLDGPPAGKHDFLCCTPPRSL